MLKFLYATLLCFVFTAVNAQSDVTPKSDLNTANADTLGGKKYVNKGKIAGQKAIYRSLIFPGLGQVYNYGLVVDDVKSGNVQGKKVLQKAYIVGKIGLIYAGGTLLVMSYMDNDKNYKLFLRELQYRKLNNNQPDTNNGLSQYPNTDALIIAKSIYKRNREVVLISLLGLYGLNVLDAYVTARLKYFNVDDTLSLKLSPTTINTDTMFGYQTVTPGLKLTLKL